MPAGRYLSRRCPLAIVDFSAVTIDTCSRGGISPAENSGGGDDRSFALAAVIFPAEMISGALTHVDDTRALQTSIFHLSSTPRLLFKRFPPPGTRCCAVCAGSAEGRQWRGYGAMTSRGWSASSLHHRPIPPRTVNLSGNDDQRRELREW